MLNWDWMRIRVQEVSGLCAMCLPAQGPLTRAELVEQLASRGIRLEGQARPHLLSRAALEGVICFGPDRGAEPTYVLLSDWATLGPALPEHAAYVELARRYLGAYGPATPEDMAAWSGLPISRIRAAWRQIADQLMEVEIDNGSAWMLKSHVAWLDEPLFTDQVVRLLPAFDIYLLGYQKRDLVVPDQFAKRVNAGGGMLHPTLLVNGRVAGTWKSERRKSQLTVNVEPFEQLAPEVYPGLRGRDRDLARFLEVPIAMQVQGRDARRMNSSVASVFSVTGASAMCRAWGAINSVGRDHATRCSITYG